MKILVVIGDYVLANSSANLCHLAYLKGFVDAGHDVTLISADGRDYAKDDLMKIPEGIECYSFYSTTLYEKLSIKKKERLNQNKTEIKRNTPDQETVKSEALVSVIKQKVFFALYGVHGIYIKFVKKAKKFKSEIIYDFVISISTPAASHLLVYELVRSGNIKYNHWVQIWEDPWYSDAYGYTKKKEIFKEEKHLLSIAERICYVSPITLINQQNLFPEAADKMFWVPLPSYYLMDTNNSEAVIDDLFGYFGDYRRPARDLKPFYEAAKSAGVEVNICGTTNLLLTPTEKIHIFPRLPLAELKPIEKRTGVLVFLSNHAGGQIPGKIYQYTATNKVILFILDGTEDEKRIIKSFFAPFNRFFFCENNKEDIEQAIRSICSGQLGNVNNNPLTQFEPKIIVEDILKKGMKRENGES